MSGVEWESSEMFPSRGGQTIIIKFTFLLRFHFTSRTKNENRIEKPNQNQNKEQQQESGSNLNELTDMTSVGTILGIDSQRLDSFGDFCGRARRLDSKVKK
jgi:hypothetical protein